MGKAENAKQTLKGNKNIDTPNDKGILESAGEYIQETAESIGSFFGATTKETEHKLKEKKHEAERKAYQEQAKNDNASLGDRVSAGANVVTEGAKELKEGAQKEYESQRRQNNIDTSSEKGYLELLKLLLIILLKQ